MELHETTGEMTALTQTQIIGAILGKEFQDNHMYDIHESHLWPRCLHADKVLQVQAIHCERLSVSLMCHYSLFLSPTFILLSQYHYLFLHTCVICVKRSYNLLKHRPVLNEDVVEKLISRVASRPHPRSIISGALINSMTRHFSNVDCPGYLVLVKCVSQFLSRDANKGLVNITGNRVNRGA